MARYDWADKYGNIETARQAMFALCAISNDQPSLIEQSARCCGRGQSTIWIGGMLLFGLGFYCLDRNPANKHRQALWTAEPRERDETRDIGIAAAYLNCPARADEPTVITWSCEGMLTPIYGGNEPKAPQLLQKTGVIVNLDEQTVFFIGYLVPIESVDEISMNFGGMQLVDQVATSRSEATLIGWSHGRNHSAFRPNKGTGRYYCKCPL